MLTTPKEEIIKLSKTDTNGANIRITLIGDQQAIKSVNKKLFTDNGMSVKTKYTDVEVTESEESEIVQELSGTDILDKFKDFCKEKNYDFEQGYELLKDIMKWQE